ncbi:MAG: 4Fe-4S binding protein [Candidatus Riflebacteria bacterium]|nr:4Fe-4S binding protein [Candidatus Riflebacteria bacterium]
MKFVKPDVTKCEGVRACEKVCAQTFFKNDDPQFSAIRVTKKDAGYEINVCNQCGQCIAVCPVQALSRNKAGIVMIDKNACVGCFMCVGFCPTQSMRRAHGQTVPFKCVSCGQCVKNCPKGALQMAEADHAGLPA